MHQLPNNHVWGKTHNMEQNALTKNSPYSVMDYNNLLMNEIHAIAFNISMGGTGIEQAHILKDTLKPKYQDELKNIFDKLDQDYNNTVNSLEKRIKGASLKSDRLKLNRKLMVIQRQYSRLVIKNVIAILDKHGALEFTQTVLQGGHNFQKVMGLG